MKAKGFTIIELLVTLGIIGTVLGAAAPVYVSKINTAHARKAGLEMLEIQQAARNYFQDHYSWPASAQALKDGGYLRSDWINSDPWGHPYEISNSGYTFTVSAAGIPERYHGGALLVLPQAARDDCNPSRLFSATAPPAGAIASRRMLHRSDDARYRTIEGSLFAPRIESNDPGKPYYIDYDSGLAYVEDLYVESLGKNISEFNPTIHTQIRTYEIQRVYDRPHGSTPAPEPGQVWHSWDNWHTVQIYTYSGSIPGTSDRKWQWNNGPWVSLPYSGGSHTITHHAGSGWTYSHASPQGTVHPRVLQDSGNGARATYHYHDFPGPGTYHINLQIWGWKVE